MHCFTDLKEESWIKHLRLRSRTATLSSILSATLSSTLSYPGRNSIENIKLPKSIV